MRAFAVAGLAFGDEGKGAVTDYLTRKHSAQLVIRYNGGPQAAHNVVTPDGVHHTFSQFGAGTLAGAHTFLSEYMLVMPSALEREARVLADKISPGDSSGWHHELMERLWVDPRAVIITPYHVLANRLRETRRGKDKHGSVGLGVGEARSDQLAGLALTAGELSSHRTVRAKLAEIKHEKELDLGVEFSDWPVERAADMLMLGWWRECVKVVRIEDLFDVCHELHYDGTVVFEGAQGVLLDETYGFQPYNTWTDCTFGKVRGLLDRLSAASPLGSRYDHLTKIGVLRSYFTRHGEGPLPTAVGSQLATEEHNATHPWMGEFRTGHFDAVLAQYAITVSMPNELAITHLDRIPSDHVCVAYNGIGEDELLSLSSEFLLNLVRPRYLDVIEPECSAREFIAWVSRALRLPVTIGGFGMSADCYESHDQLWALSAEERAHIERSIDKSYPPK